MALLKSPLEHLTPLSYICAAGLERVARSSLEDEPWRWSYDGRMANPYGAQLGDKDARAVLASTPGLIHQAVCALSPEQIEAPIAAGRWSPRLIVAHLADCELAFSWRLRQVLAAPASEPAQLEAFDQDLWAQHYSVYDLPAALELFRAARVWNLKLIGALSQADMERHSYHPERGVQTFNEILQMIAGHDLNHVVQLQGVVGREA